MKIKRKNYFQNTVFAILGTFVMSSAMFVVAPNQGQVVAQAQYFAAACEPGDNSLPEAVFVPWYKYLDGETDDGTGKCSPVLSDDYPKAISLIALAVLDTLLRVSGILATAYLIWGAIQYITSQGDQNGIANAKNTILNAIVGLVIVLLSIGVVQFVGNLAR